MTNWIVPAVGGTTGQPAGRWRWLSGALGAVVEQYRKTAAGTQVVIALVTLCVILQSHRLAAAAAFFGTMQLGAALGAVWAVRLRGKIERGRSGARA